METVEDAAKAGDGFVRFRDREVVLTERQIQALQGLRKVAKPKLKITELGDGLLIEALDGRCWNMAADGTVKRA